MVVALTTAQKLGIAAIAGSFIVFALISSFVAPLRDRNFPGRRGLPFFVAITAVLFASMMFAIVALAREEEEEGEHAEEPAATETKPAEEARGDAEAGKDVFASAGCGGCHTLQAAGSSGMIGPNLDQAKPGYEKIVTQVTNGGGGMPPFGDQLSDAQIQDVAAFVFEATRGS